MEKLKPRQLDIMQNLAKMLEAKGPVKVTTASLARECGITEAAIYRHFPSKKKIYEGLVEFCEQSLFDLIGDINSSKDPYLKKVSRIMILLVSFSEKNPGLARLLTREAFSVEEASLDDRIKQMFSKIELQIKGYASPLFASDYNINLSKRRIVSLLNYMHEFQNGSITQYLKNEQLVIIELPFGESVSNKNVSDNPRNKKLSVYSVEAAMARKIEIVRVTVKE